MCVCQILITLLTNIIRYGNLWSPGYGHGNLDHSTTHAVNYVKDD